MRHSEQLPQPRLITSREEIESMVTILEKEATIGVDTEFIRETSFYPRIALIQLASLNQSFLVDPTVLEKSDLSSLLGLLENPEVLKVIHASHSDQECLFWSYGIVAKPVLDTSIAAALCGMGDSIGLQKLLREILGVYVSKGRARAKWLARPLSSELLHYAEQDVAHLVSLSQKMKEVLDRHQRWDWALEESQVEVSSFDVSPESLASKMAKGAHLEKEQPILTELVAWREKRAREANLPRGWIADNEVLVALARSQPKSLEELKTFRGLHSKEVDRNGDAILNAIRKGKELCLEFAPEVKKEIPRIDSHAVKLLETYLAFLATREEIMPRFLMNNHQTSQILHHLDKSKEQWVELGVLSAQAAKLIGDDLKSFFTGKKALRIQNKRLAIVDLS
ncbi:MAG: ribonuclease D [Pseudomonadota bacterium]